MIRLVELRIDSIKMGDRVRQDLGDIDALAESIRTIGMIHPPVITTGQLLLAGGRRLEACKRLGMQIIPFRMIDSAKGLVDCLAVEEQENTCRKDFTPAEAAAMRAKRASALESVARANTAANLKKGQVAPSGKVATSGKVGKVRDAAAAGTGFSGRTLDKVDAVRRAIDDPNPVVAETARVAFNEIHKTGKVDAAFKKVAEVEKEQIGGTAYADAKYVAAIAKQIHITRDLFTLEPQRVAELADLDTWDSIDRLERSFAEWMNKVRAARPGLRRAK